MKSVLLVVAMLVLLAPAAFAKSAAPVEVTPVTNAGIEYRAPSGVEKMGVVEAWDKATDKMVWEKKVYEVSIDPNLEKDVHHANHQEQAVSTDRRHAERRHDASSRVTRGARRLGSRPRCPASQGPDCERAVGVAGTRADAPRATGIRACRTTGISPP